MACSSEAMLLPWTPASLSVTVPRLFDSCWMWQPRVMAHLGSLRLHVYCFCAASCQDKLFLLAGLSITGALSALGNQQGPAATSWQVMNTVQRTNKRIIRHEESGLHAALNLSQTHTHTEINVQQTAVGLSPAHYWDRVKGIIPRGSV